MDIKTGFAWKTINGPNLDMAVADNGTRISLYLNDGTFLMFLFFRWNHVEGENDKPYFIKQQYVYADINGPKLPNLLGKDVFAFTVDLNKEVIVPYGTDASVSAVNSNCSKLSTGGGLYCAAKIIMRRLANKRRLSMVV